MIASVHVAASRDLARAHVRDGRRLHAHAQHGLSGGAAGPGDAGRDRGHRGDDPAGHLRGAGRGGLRAHIRSRPHGRHTVEPGRRHVRVRSGRARLHLRHPRRRLSDRGAAAPRGRCVDVDARVGVDSGPRLRGLRVYVRRLQLHGGQLRPAVRDRRAGRARLRGGLASRMRDPRGRRPHVLGQWARLLARSAQRGLGVRARNDCAGPRGRR